MIRPWRRAGQWLGALLFFSLPFLRWEGVSLLRLDIPSWTLYFFGRQLRLEEFYLLGLVLLALLFFLLLLTMVLGRVWCGWCCPQTWLNNLAEWLARRLGLRVEPAGLGGSWFRRPALQAFYLLLALLVGLTLVWYFVAPEIYWQQLRAGELGSWPLGFTLVLTVLVYCDLALVRRLACRDFCPYGRFQAILLDRGTLTLGVTADHERRCLDCRSCVRACPMGIDIRRGFQVECINCGNCRDACRRVMARVEPGRPGLIQYRFGWDDGNRQALLTPRLLLVGLVFLLSLTAFFYLAGQRQAVSLQVARLVTAEAPAAGPAIHRFRAQVANRTAMAAEYRLVVRGRAGNSFPEDPAGPVIGQGADFFVLEAGERRQLLFAVVLPPAAAGEVKFLTFLLVDRAEREHAPVSITW
ncbi:4Fe-4S dicluster domain-containing protein [Desulfurivibrio sp. C05AmB]|jgi:cytochrome c oxidase accessory protein FixG|uniref:4Fe-4S dicluster domain-containing protein n=1 Tax=Desulfurivibrio sp. C05AmB TaxID=3374371 RepID=UPI00376F3823